MKSLNNNPMKTKTLLFSLVTVAFGVFQFTAHAETVWLDNLRVNLTSQEWGTPGRNRSVQNAPLSVGGQSFDHGLGTHANREQSAIGG